MYCVDDVFTRLKRQLKMDQTTECYCLPKSLVLSYHIANHYIKWTRLFIHTEMSMLKVIRKLFLTITKVLDGISGITKNIFFFYLKACERRNFETLIFVCSYECVVGPCSYISSIILATRTDTKIKVSPLTGPQM